MALRQSPEFIIDGDRYRVTNLPATRSRGLHLRIMKAIGKPLAEMIGKGSDADLAEAVEALLVKIDEQLLADLCAAFGEVTQINGIPELADEKSFDRFFSGRILVLYKWLYHCLKWEYSDFLDGLPTLLERVGSLTPAETPQPSESPST